MSVSDHVEALKARAESAEAECGRLRAAVVREQQEALAAEARAFNAERERDRAARLLAASEQEKASTFALLERERDEARADAERLREALRECEGYLCERELCGHYTAEEIRGVVRAALADPAGGDE